MKKSPAVFELDQKDIENAIDYWLCEVHSDGTVPYFNITIKTEEKRLPPPGGHQGGMSDDVIQTVITAVAVEAEH